MELFNDIYWSLLKDIILPHSGTLVWNIALFCVAGFILLIFYIVILYKKGVFKRKPKYYNWAVKLYIPLIIGFFFFVFSQIGLLRGIYKIIDREKTVIVSGIYDYTIGEIFKSEESKKEFITVLQDFIIKQYQNPEITTTIISSYISHKNTGVTVIDEQKNRLSSYIIKKYEQEIYTAIIYGLLRTQAPHVKFDKSTSYKEFNDAFTEIILNVKHTEIEEIVKKEINTWTTKLIKTQYKSFIVPLVILLIIGSILPIIEFLIYKKWILPKYLKGNSKDS